MLLKCCWHGRQAIRQVARPARVLVQAAAGRLAVATTHAVVVRSLTFISNLKAWASPPPSPPATTALLALPAPQKRVQLPRLSVLVNLRSLASLLQPITDVTAKSDGSWQVRTTLGGLHLRWQLQPHRPRLLLRSSADSEAPGHPAVMKSQSGRYAPEA